MARNCYVVVFLTLWSFLCVSALEEGGISSLEKEEVKVVKEEQILSLPSQEDSKNQEAIPWEQSPIEIHSLRFPRKPMMGENRDDHPNFQQVRIRPVRFRFGRPGGCHGKFKQFLMSREDPSQAQLLRRMGMGHLRHAHVHPHMFPAIEDLGNDGKTSFRTFHAHLNPEREEMGFDKHRERVFEGGFRKREEEHKHEHEHEHEHEHKHEHEHEHKHEHEHENENENEREAPWTAWVRSMLN